MAEGPVLVQVPWHANPMRGDKMAAGLAKLAEAAIDYGALSWQLYRTLEGGLDFIQEVLFPSKLDFDRYWYSDEVGEIRTELAGWYQVPLLPSYHEIIGEGRAVTPEPAG